MKLPWKITIGIAVAGTVVALLLSRPNRSEQTAAEETRRALRQQGFKTDLADFNFSIPAELRARETALTNADLTGAALRGEYYARRSALREGKPELLFVVGSNSAIVVWKQNVLRSDSGEDIWPMLREVLGENQGALDTACEAASAGPIRFGLEAGRGSAMLLRHLSAVKNLAQTLGTRAVLNLHDENGEAAWTNVLAATRLVTAWEPEPTEVSHLVRFACMGIACNITWQALQAEGWPDQRLAQLQREWEAVDFLKSLPETAAFSRASAVATCQLERQQPLTFGMTYKEMLRSPKNAWLALTEQLRQIRYRNHGSYEDQKGLLLHFRDRELELRRAIQSPTWMEMRQLAGVTNLIPFRSKYPSAIQAQLNMRQLALSWQMYSSQDLQGRAQGFPSRAAEAEARRRLIITAIALERYRRAHGVYPKTLPELVPGFLAHPPLDFMDGQPLRYRSTDDGRFVLHSVGLDCTDDGGRMPQRGARGLIYQGGRPVQTLQETDLVWPRPASPAELEAFQKEQLNALAGQTDQSAEHQAAAQWERTARRQAKVESILAAKQDVPSTEPTYRGRALNEVLRNEAASGANRLRLDEMLTLNQVVTGEEPEIATFAVPANYDALTNLGSLGLWIDPIRDEDSDEGCHVGWLETRRATNGNCLLVWNTIYESPGKHALQLGLLLDEPEKRGAEFFTGPIMPFFVSNLCQFSLSSAYFNPAVGVTLRPKLPEPTATYTLQLTTPAGEVLETMTGSTSNSVMKVFWDLKDGEGRRCTNQSFGTVFNITLPASGRSQTQKGP